MIAAVTNSQYAIQIVGLRQGGFVLCYYDINQNKEVFKIYENNMTIRVETVYLGTPNTYSDFYNLIALRNGTFGIFQAASNTKNYYQFLSSSYGNILEVNSIEMTNNQIFTVFKCQA